MYLVKELDLPQRYGKGSWAVVTGCTEGIGLEFCSSLARRGFNLVMVARNLDKIEARARHIVENNRNIMYKSIVADCDKDGADPELYKSIMTQIGDIDVSILVNNVGILEHPSFVDGNTAKVFSMIKVNMYSQAIMQQKFLKRFQQRSKRSAIINLGSSLTIEPNSLAPLYAATKIFCKFLSIGLSNSGEYDKTDFLCLRPNATSTALTKHTEVNPTVTSPEETVSYALKCLGTLDETYGHPKHVRFGVIFESLYWFLPRRTAESLLSVYRRVFSYKKTN